MGRFADTAEKDPFKDVVSDTESSSPFQAAERSSTETKGRFLNQALADTVVPGVQQVKDVGKKIFEDPRFQRIARSPQAAFILKGFHLLGRPASELTAGAAGLTANVNRATGTGSEATNQRLEAIRAKNLAARGNFSFDSSFPFIHYAPGGPNAFASDYLKAEAPGLEPTPDQPFLPSTVGEIPGSAVGNIKRAVNFAADVAGDPLVYIHGPGLTRAGKIAKQVEAHAEEGLPIKLQSKLASKISEELGQPVSAQLIKTAKQSGRFGKLAETASEQIAKGQKNLLSFKPPMTDLEIPLLPRDLQVGIAKGAEAVGSAIVDNPVVKQFADEAKRLFSTQTGNRAYDNVVREFKDLVSYRQGAKIGQAEELNTRIDQLAKKMGKSRDEVNNMITAAVETKPSGPSVAGAEPFISKVPGMGGAPSNDWASRILNEAADKGEQAPVTAQDWINKFYHTSNEDLIKNKDQHIADLSQLPPEDLNKIRDEFAGKASPDEPGAAGKFGDENAQVLDIVNKAKQSQESNLGKMPEDIKPYFTHEPDVPIEDSMKVMQDNGWHEGLGKMDSEDTLIDWLEGASEVDLDVVPHLKNLMNKLTENEFETEFRNSKAEIAKYIEDLKNSWSDPEARDAAFLEHFSGLKKAMEPNLENAQNLDNLFSQVDDGAVHEFHGLFDAKLSELKDPSIRDSWASTLQELLKQNPNPTLEDVKIVAHDFLNSVRMDTPKANKINLDELFKEARKNYPGGFGPTPEADLREKFPDIKNVYNQTRNEVGDQIKNDLITNKPTTPEQAKGYIGKWINYAKDFNGTGISDNSKLNDPWFEKQLEVYEQTRGKLISQGLPTDVRQNQLAKIKGLANGTLIKLYGMDPADNQSVLRATTEFLQDLITDQDRLALGNYAPRKYQPGALINEVYGRVRDSLMEEIYKTTGVDDFKTLMVTADNAIGDLFHGYPFKLGNQTYGKELNLLSGQDILNAMVSRGALGAQTEGEPLVTKLMRAFPNFFSVPYRMMNRPKGPIDLSWIGLHTRVFQDLKNMTGADIGEVLDAFQKQVGALPKEVIDRSRAIINLAPQARAVALKHEDMAINALEWGAKKRLLNKMAGSFNQLYKDPKKAIKLLDRLIAYEKESSRVFGTVNATKVDPSAFQKTLNKVANGYTMGLMGSNRYLAEDTSKLVQMANEIVGDIFEIKPNDLIGNMKAFKRVVNRDPNKVYKDYIKWVKAHESGHRFLGSGDEFGNVWSILPKDMRDEFSQIFRNDRDKAAELLDPMDSQSISENFANGNGFYLTFPQVMKDLAPNKFKFFQQLYTPGTKLEPEDLISSQNIIGKMEKANPILADQIRQMNPDLFDGTTQNFYTHPKTGDPALDSIVKTIKEINQKQLTIEKASGVRITPLAADIDYIAHSMTPEARDLVMDNLKAQGKLPRAITAKEFSTKLANAVRRDFTTIKTDVVKKMYEAGELEKADYKKLLDKEDGLAHLDKMLDDGKISDTQYTDLVHSMTVQEVNAKAAQGGLKILGGKEVGEFFHEDPVYSTTIRGVRGERARTNAEFYQELIDRGIAVPSDKAPRDWVDTNVNELNGYKVEPEVAGHLNAFRKSVNDPQSPIAFLRLFDQVQNWWKSWTLAIFPAYHNRNFVGNMWNNYLAGVRDPRVYKMAADLQRGAQFTFKAGDGHVYNAPELLDIARKTGVLDRGWVGADVQTSIAQALEDPKLLSFGRNSKILKLGFKVGRSIENNARLGHFIDRLIKGDTAVQAARSVKKYLFDYDELTQFERKAMKRLFPFYTWTRKNVPLQLEHLITRPARYSILDKAQHEIETPNKPMEKYLPEWMLENYPQRIRYNKKTGEYEYFLLSSWLPAADINKLLDLKETAAGMATPIPKEILQQMFNYDVFLKRPIESIPGEKVKFLGRSVPARVAHAAKLIRLLNEADKMSKDDVDISNKISSLLTGKTYPFDERKAIYQNKLRVDDDMKTLYRAADRAQARGDSAEVQRIKQMLIQKGQEY